MAVLQVDKIIRVTWLYTLLLGGNPADTSQHSVCYRAGTVPSSPADLNAVLQQMADTAVTQHGTSVNKSHYSGGVTLEHVRVSLEGTNGHTLAEEFQNANPLSPWTGTGGTISMPWETSLCVSTYAYTPGTFDTLARSKRGRFYLPPMAPNVLDTDASGEVTATVASTVMSDWSAVLGALQSGITWAFPGFDPVLGVNSRTSMVRGAGVPDFYPITYLQTNSKVDSQRRRQRQEPQHGSILTYP